jgi:cellulose synthase operon protein YhjQ
LTWPKGLRRLDEWHGELCISGFDGSEYTESDGRNPDAAEGQTGAAMDSIGREAGDEEAVAGTPEDVAALYKWAHLQGAKYRDFSASRREYRAQVRHRAAKAMQERELQEKAAAEAEAATAEQVELDAMAAAQQLDGAEKRGLRMQSLASAEEAAGRATAARLEAIHRGEAAAHAAAMAQREEREIASAHASARRQALRYVESEARQRQLAGPQPRGAKGSTNKAPSAGLVAESGYESQASEEADQWAIDRALMRELSVDLHYYNKEAQGAAEAEAGPTGPAWLYASQTPPQTQLCEAIEQLPHGEMPRGKVEGQGGETLQDSRERVAARWYALKGVFEEAAPELPAMLPVRPRDAQTPLLAIFSLAGGVGKTSLAATLGRALSLQGEKVVLTDTTSSGLLPYYFGEREVHPGEVRTFQPPEGRNGTAISLAIHDAVGMNEDKRWQEILTEEILRNGQGKQRAVLDLASGSSWLIRRMADMHPIVLVPMTGDMNSVISLQAVERVFRGIADSDGRFLLPYYVLNQFDVSLPLHLDVREVLRRQLGDRLLRIAIRRSPAVSEALAEGMTVLDYEPDAAVSQDYLDVAAWLRIVSPPATAVTANLQRSAP